MKPHDPAEILAHINALPQCGDDLEYDVEFLSLQQALVEKVEQQFGATIIPAEMPEWTQVERLARSLCERTCDLRVLVPLTRAWTESRGLVGFVDGLRIIDHVLQTQWSHLHPRLVLEDGDDDPMPRMNALAALTDASGLGRCVRDAILVEEGGLQVSVRMAENLLDPSRKEAQELLGGVPRLRDVLAQAAQTHRPSVSAVPEALALLQRVRRVAEDQLGQAWVPDFGRLERTFSVILKLLPQPVLPSASDAPQVDVDSGVQARDLGVQASAQPSVNPALRIEDIRIQGRDEVRLLLEKVCQYLESSEPSHPSPILIRRAQRLLDLNFMQIIEELVPEGVEKIHGLAGQVARESS